MGKPQPSAVVEVIDTFKMAPTSPSSRNMLMFHNLHMLLMCIWMSPYHIPAVLVGQAIGSYQVKFWLPPEGQTAAQCYGWGYWHIQDSSNINCKHFWRASQPSYDVDVRMDESLPHFCCSCRPISWKLSKILVTSWGTNHFVVLWLRLYAFKMDPTTMSSKDMMLHNLHDVMWMYIWMCPYHITGVLFSQALGS